MLRAIIADDEQYIIELIISLVNWNDLGISVIGQASTGREALNLIVKEKPEIVISDIRMPGMDGLNLVKNVKELNIETNFILISGHKEFQYAYGAIKYGVEYYMLKPINEKELVRNLVQITDKIKSKEAEASRMEDIIGNSRERFLRDIVNIPQSICSQSNESLKKEFQLNYNYSKFRLLLLKADYKIVLDEKQKRIIIDQINNLLTASKTPNNYEITSISMTNQVLSLISYDDITVLELFKNAFEEIKLHYSDYCYLTLGIGPQVTSVGELNYKSVMKKIVYRLAYGPNRIIESEVNSFKAFVPLKDESLNTLQKNIELADLEQIISWLESNQAVFLATGLDPYNQYLEAKKCVEYIMNGISNHYKDAGNNPYSQEILDANLYDSYTRQKLFVSLKDYCINAVNDFLAKKASDDTKYVRFAKQYVIDHYSESISLNDISEKIYLNSAYFSTLFKKQTGTSFTDYLINYRIDIAKKLLKESNLKIGEIAAKIGYKSSKHFSKLFSSIAGISPSDYRRLYG